MGKSVFVQRQLEDTHVVIDPDRLKVLCPVDDSDPDGQDSITYLWTKQTCNQLMEEAITNLGKGSLKSYAFPGTGKGIGTSEDATKSYKLDFLLRARAAGFRLRVIYLHCPEPVALERNASRQRQLPNDLVVSSLKHAARAYACLSHVADAAESVDVGDDDSFWHGRSATFRRQLSSFSRKRFEQKERQKQFEGVADRRSSKPSRARGTLRWLMASRWWGACTVAHEVRRLDLACDSPVETPVASPSSARSSVSSERSHAAGMAGHRTVLDELHVQDLAMAQGVLSPARLRPHMRRMPSALDLQTPS